MRFADSLDGLPHLNKVVVQVSYCLPRGSAGVLVRHLKHLGGDVPSLERREKGLALEETLTHRETPATHGRQ
jgi:hypothetical protein